MWNEEFERGMLYGTGLMILNLLIGFVATIVLATPMIGVIAGSGAFLELGVLLILGGCLMSRQPLKDEDRYKEDGSPVSTWRLALLGRQAIVTGVFLFIYALVIAVIGLFIVI
jgi:hypothetical protein